MYLLFHHFEGQASGHDLADPLVRLTQGCNQGVLICCLTWGITKERAGSTLLQVIYRI
jgi:hypothetical protein